MQVITSLFKLARVPELSVIGQTQHTLEFLLQNHIIGMGRVIEDQTTFSRQQIKSFSLE